jgi:hypothetical protein
MFTRKQSDRESVAQGKILEILNLFHPPFPSTKGMEDFFLLVELNGTFFA